MSKIIIYNQSETHSDEEALALVSQVIKNGRVSDDGRAYCYLTTFRLLKGMVSVSAVRNKHSDTFTVYDD